MSVFEIVTQNAIPRLHFCYGGGTPISKIHPLFSVFCPIPTPRSLTEFKRGHFVAADEGTERERRRGEDRVREGPLVPSPFFPFLDGEGLK